MVIGAVFKNLLVPSPKTVHAMDTHTNAHIMMPPFNRVHISKTKINRDRTAQASVMATDKHINVKAKCFHISAMNANGVLCERYCFKFRNNFSCSRQLYDTNDGY